MSTTTKKTTAAAKVATKETVPAVEIAKKASTPAPAARVYKGDDLIPCRSVTRGGLVCVGKKSGEIYRWSDYGDVTEVEYQDLMGLRASKTRFIYGPLFIIEDEELLADPKWKDVVAVYEKALAYEDLNTMLELPPATFRVALENLPKAMRKAVATEVSTRLSDGLFDSLQKVKIVDEICGTDLKLLL